MSIECNSAGLDPGDEPGRFRLLAEQAVEGTDDLSYARRRLRARVRKPAAQVIGVIPG